MVNRYLTYFKNMQVMRFLLCKDNQGALILQNMKLLLLEVKDAVVSKHFRGQQASFTPLKEMGLKQLR